MNLMNNIDRHFKWIAYPTMTAALFVVVYVGVLLLWPHNILEQRNPIDVITPTVKIGTNVILKFDFCKFEQYPSDVSFFLIDNTPFALRTIAGNLPNGCRDDMRYAVLIPETVEPGVYTIRQNITYHVNALRDVHYVFESVRFNVIK